MVKMCILVFLAWTSHGKVVHREQYMTYVDRQVTKDNVCIQEAPTVVAKIKNTALYEGKAPDQIDWDCKTVF